MSDREIVLIISIALLLVFIIYQRVKINALWWSVDAYEADLDEERLLRATENALNQGYYEEALEAKEKEIRILRKAIEGSEKARRELAAKHLEVRDD